MIFCRYFTTKPLFEDIRNIGRYPERTREQRCGALGIESIARRSHLHEHRGRGARVAQEMARIEEQGVHFPQPTTTLESAQTALEAHIKRSSCARHIHPHA